MKHILFGTTALAFAGAMVVGQASAADKLSVGISGYMTQWVGMTSIEEGMYGETMREGAVDVRSNSEIHFKGSMEADNGLTFGVRVELEGNNSGNQGTPEKSRGGVIDESFAWVTGEFGRLTIGAEDTAQASMHQGVPNAGMDLGEVRMFFPENEAYYTANWTADNKRLLYMTPVMEGFQFGASYGPGANENYGHQSDGDLANNDAETWSAAVKFAHGLGDMAVKLSVGYLSQSEEDAVNIGAQVSTGAITATVAHLTDDIGSREMTVAGLMYTDGPLKVSGNFGMTDHDGTKKGEVSIGMLSVGYNLAPGVDVRSSLFASESDATKVTKSNGSMADFEGSGFVMGLAIGF